MSFEKKIQELKIKLPAPSDMALKRMLDTDEQKARVVQAVKGLGIFWLSTLIKLIHKNYPKYNIKFYVDAGNDYGLSILIMRENIDYLKLKSDKIILNKIHQIAKKNKVLLNPNFDVVETSNLKNIKNINI